MTWLTARAALKNTLNGQKVTVSGHEEETLTCLERPPAGVQDASVLPLAIIRVPARRQVVRAAGGLRQLEVTVDVDLMLASDNLEEVESRLEAWIAKLIDVVGLNQKLDTPSVSVLDQSFGSFVSYGATDNAPPYGFSMELVIVIHDVESRGP